MTPSEVMRGYLRQLLDGEQTKGGKA
jgi:hypothetical protein